MFSFELRCFCKVSRNRTHAETASFLQFNGVKILTYYNIMSEYWALLAAEIVY